MGDAPAGDGVGQRLGDVVLADDIGEPLRAVLASYDLVTHGKATGRVEKAERPAQEIPPSTFRLWS